MIFQIRSMEHAEQILRMLDAQNIAGAIVFDIDEKVDAATVPLCLRRCQEHNYEYCGPNVQGSGFYKPAIYCTTCGYAMRTSVEVVFAMQGDRVVFRNYWQTRSY